jgi:hypothetical protein
LKNFLGIMPYISWTLSTASATRKATRMLATEYVRQEFDRLSDRNLHRRVEVERPRRPWIPADCSDPT